MSLYFGLAARCEIDSETDSRWMVSSRCESLYNFDTSAIPVALLGLLACNGFCQTSTAADPLENRSLFISGVPTVILQARDYQKFFDEVKYLGQRLITVEARRTLHFTDQELRSLITITADLADESLFFQKIIKPWIFESRMEFTEAGTISPCLEQKLSDLRDEWAKTILDHAHRLRAALGEERFQSVDTFIHSGKSMFEVPPGRREP